MFTRALVTACVQHEALRLIALECDSENERIASLATEAARNLLEAAERVKAQHLRGAPLDGVDFFVELPARLGRRAAVMDLFYCVLETLDTETQARVKAALAGKE